MAKKGPIIEETKLGTDIVKRIDKKADDLGISRPELSDKVKIARNTFANWYARGTVPPADVALAIADELQCSVRWLITGKKEKQDEYPSNVKTLITKFQNLDAQGQFEIMALLDAKSVPVEAEKKHIG